MKGVHITLAFDDGDGKTVEVRTATFSPALVIDGDSLWPNEWKFVTSVLAVLKEHRDSYPLPSRQDGAK